MSTTHFYGDDCNPPHEKYEPDPKAKEEFFARLHEVEDKIAKEESRQTLEGVRLQLLVEEANVTFDEMCQRRHDEGAQKYGPVKFLGANTLEEAMAEVIDLANYARYTFIKLSLLNTMLAEKVQQEFGDEGTEMLGTNQFVPNSKKFRSNG